MSSNRPYVWQMVKEAVQSLGSPTTNVAVRDWILKKYPGVNPHTISCQIIVTTVNHNSRIHYPEGQKPRISNGQYDFLFRPDKGKLEWYEPEKHGIWQIVKKDDGTLSIATGDRPVEDAIEGATAGRCFAAEAHLRDYLVKHLNEIEAGLELFVDEDGTDGVEYITDVGRMDILAVDSKEDLVVIELKVEQTPDAVCGQLMRYRGWVKRHLAGGKKVRGIIIGQSIGDKLRYATADLPDVELREYELALTFKAIQAY